MNEEFDFSVWWQDEGIYIFIEAGDTRPFIASAVKQVMEEQYLKGFKAGRDEQRESDAELVQSDFEFVEEYDPSDGFLLAERVINNTGDL